MSEKDKKTNGAPLRITLDNKTFQSHLIKIISLPVIFIILLLAYFHFQNAYRYELIADMDNLDKTILDSIRFERSLTDMALAVRNFSSDGNTEFLGIYEEAQIQIAQIEEQIFFSLSGGYELTKQFREFLQTYVDWKSNANRFIDARKSNLPLAEMVMDNGQEKFEIAKSSLENFKLSLLGIKKQKQIELQQMVDITNALEVVFALVFVLLLTFLISRQLKELTNSYKELLKKNYEGIKQIEATSKSKDLFLANMSHEIRTPLGAIMGFAELISEDETLSPEVQNHIAFIRRNSEHLLGLIDDLFDLSKITADKLDVSAEEINLKSLTEDIKNIFSSKLVDKKINLDIRLDTRIPRVIQSDPIRVKQILSNLIGNAIKFSPNKSKVDVIFSFFDGKLIIDVIDRGIGIAPEAQKIIFDTFSQADANHSRKFGGAGLGLSISKKLAELLDGDIDLVSSNLHVGSHFRFTLPINDFESDFLDHDEFNKSSLATQSNAVDYLETAKRIQYDFSDKNILLAEDSKENQILFKIFIEASKANLTIVDNGTEAVREALSNDFDLILMDIQMPGLDGYEALKILRGSHFDKKIIALTAHTMRGEREKCLSSGFDGYLTKPISQNKLLSTMNSYLSN